MPCTPSLMSCTQSPVPLTLVHAPRTLSSLLCTLSPEPLPLQIAALHGCVSALCLLARIHSDLEPSTTQYAHLAKVRHGRGQYTTPRV